MPSVKHKTERRGKMSGKGKTRSVMSRGGSANRGAILSGNLKKPENRLTSFEKMELTREGVSKKELESLKENAGLDYDRLARALQVTRATLINRKGKEKFNTSLSERIVALADIYSLGYEVFGDRNKFNSWVFRENRALGGKCPFDLFESSFGREEVKNLIGRIQFGVYS